MRFFQLLICCFSIFSCQAQSSSQIKKDNIFSEVFLPANPLLKDGNNNPVIQLKIAVGKTDKDFSFTNFSAEFLSGIKSIEKLELYYTGFERTFSKDSLVGIVAPRSAAFQIPTSLILKPGVHYFWLHAVLSDDADLDEKFKFRLNSFTGSGKSYLPVNKEAVNTQYPGIALRKAWDDSVHTYRIPGISTTNKGSLISVYDIRYKHAGDLPANIDVGMNRSVDGGRTWEPMKTIMDMGPPHENNGIGDPAILFDPATNKLWVAALWSKGNNSIRDSRPGLSPDSSGQFVLVSSDDDGLTWSEPYNITTQVKNPKWHLYFNGPGNGIVMKNGTLVFPSQYWDESKKPGLPHSSIIYSEDNGKTWKSGIGAKPNTTEAQVVETTPGTLMLNMRDNRGRYRSIATTTDMGKTWVEHPTSSQALIDPVCMASFIKAEVKVNGVKKEVLFFSNVSSQTARINMSVKASVDLGESWPKEFELLLDERPGYGYSTLTKIDDDTIGILYEGVRDLYFVRVPVMDILK